MQRIPGLKEEIVQKNQRTHAYSLATIANANVPGKTMNPIVSNVFNPWKKSLLNMVIQPSTSMLIIANAIAMIGLNQKIVANGFDIPISFECMRS